MAITNAQQYQQLVNKPADGKRPGYRGEGEYQGGRGIGGSKSSSSKSSSSGGSTEGGDRQLTGDDYRRAKRDFEVGVAGGTADLDTFKEKTPEIKTPNFPGFLSAGINFFKKPLQKFSDFTAAKNRPFFIDEVVRAGKIPGLNFGTVSEMTEDELEDAYKNYMSSRLAGEIDAYGNTLNQGDGEGSNILLPQNMMAEAPSIMDQETEVEEDPFKISRRFAAEGGIMNTNVVGGEMDFDSARQMYGLGKLVKKITRGVKKIAKSPIGKAALIGGGGYLLGGGIIPGLSGKLIPFAKYGNSAGTGFGFNNILPNILNIAKMPGLAEKASSMGSVGNVLTGITAASTIAGMLTPQQEEEAQLISDQTGIDIEEIRANPDKYLGRRFRAEGGRIGLKEGEGIMKMASYGYDDAMGETFAEFQRLRKLGEIPMDMEFDEYLDQLDIDIPFSKKDKDSPSIKLAEGGKPEPVAKKTMPLLDMDGQEMDLRAEGGFVPLGRMEKADDVPARLSKNEFVFTADAVRNAGEGDVDKGAEVMYNMMKNLESGGEVSEESQGLEGAREMFQTSQRLEEVI